MPADEEFFGDDDLDTGADDGQDEGEPPPEDKGGDKGSDKGDDKGKGGDDRYAALEASVAEMRQQNARLLELLTESRKPAPAAKDEEEDDEDEDEGDPSKIVDELSEKGIEALAKRGLLTKKAARDLVEKVVEAKLSKHTQASTAQASESAALLQDYPDLANPQSSLAQKTNEIFAQDCARDPKLKGSISAYRMAARAAKAELGVRETDRRGRVSAQEPPARSSRRSDEEPGSGALTSAQRNVIERFGISEDDFRKQQKELAGTGRRRNR